jgi:hypothetical protein
VNQTVTIWVDAESGEITHYANYDYADGTISEAEAVSLAQQYANKFANMSSDAVLYNVTIWNPLTNIVLTPGSNQTEFIPEVIYSVVFSRMKNSVPSDDGIQVLVSTSGQLVQYDKVWTLIMPGSTVPIITESQAITIAEGILNSSANNTELVIKRPNFYWVGGEYTFGYNEGKLSWVVDLIDENSRRASVWVDALDGEVIGGWQAY